jgi:4-coumarate--CoA ligase
MTETSGVTSISAGTVDTTEMPVSIGKMCPNLEGKIVDSKGDALPLGEAGELWLRGTQIMQGYLNNPKATQETITADGWLRTGDIAKFGKSGDIYLVDRLKEVIKVKGFQVRKIPPRKLF